MNKTNYENFIPRFSIRSLLIVVGVAAIAGLWAGTYWRQRPPEQVPYSKARLAKALKNGQPVFLTIDADWAINVDSSRPRFLSALVSEELRSRNVLAMNADWTMPSNEVDDLVKRLNLGKVPALILYDPAAPTSPTAFPLSTPDDEILAALDGLRYKSPDVSSQ